MNCWPMRHRLLALLLSLIGTGGWAGMVVLDADAGQIDLSGSLALLHDPDGKLHYTEVLAMDSAFRMAGHRDLIRSFNAGVFWLRFSLLHTGSQPLTRWLVVGTPKINTVTLYLQSGPQWQVMQSGRSIPLGQKPIIATNAVFPITLAPGQNREVLVRVVVRGATDMTTSLWEPQAYRFQSGEGKLLLVGMLTGVLVSAALSLIVFIRLREMQYGWMTLFLIAIAGVESARENLIGFYLWPHHTAVPLQILSVFGGLAVFSLAKVISHALDLPRHIVPAEKLFLATRWLAVGAVALSGFDYGVGVRLLAVTAIIIHFSGLILPVALWHRGIGSARWFGAAFALGLLLETARQLANLGILPWATAMNFSLAGYLLAAPLILVGMIEQTRQLTQQLAVAEQLQTAQSAFLARISHELRSPLNTILGYARMLQRGSARMPLHEGTAGIEKSTLRLLGLIDELLDTSRAAAGKLAVSLTPTLFVPWLDELCASVPIFIEARGNRFVCERQGDLPSAIAMDGQRLRQVLENLLNNANRHTHSGEIRLKCSAQHDDTLVTLKFAVCDTGEGIALERLKTIFEPFVRGDAAEHEDGHSRSGFGLGLPICRELVRQMGSEIAVSSTPRRGSCFSFTLQCPLVAPPTAKAERPHAVPKRQSPNDLNLPASCPRILLVDDESQQLELLRDLLDDAGFITQSAQSGKGALAILAQQAWDAIITDQMMDDGNGWFVLQQARASLPRVPVILLSAVGPQRPDDFPSEINFDAVLKKPAQSQELLATILWLILKVSAGEAAISTESRQALATLASEGDVSGIEDWINALPASPITQWMHAALNRLDFDLLQHLARRYDH
ncbi:MAG: ATP-binding protein [Rhodoferax sp.]